MGQMAKFIGALFVLIIPCLIVSGIITGILANIASGGSDYDREYIASLGMGLAVIMDLGLSAIVVTVWKTKEPKEKVPEPNKDIWAGD